MLRKILLIFSVFLLSFHETSGQECSLDHFVQTGLANNPLLKDISNQVKLNRFDSLIARAAYLPKVNFNSQLYYAPTISGWGYSDAITNGQTLQGTVGISQEIFNKKTREANFRKYGITGMNLDNAVRITENDLRRAITAQYLATYAAFRELDFQRQTLRTLHLEEEILAQWVEHGIYPRTDLLSLKIEILSLEQSMHDLDIQYAREFSNLNLICGIDDTTSCQLSLPDLKPAAITNVENLPDFKKYFYDSLQIRNEQVLIDRQYKPSVSWFSDAGILSSDPQTVYKNFGLSAGISMTLPVYDGHQRQLNQSKLKTSEESRKMYSDYYRFRYNAHIRLLQDELAKVGLQVKESDKFVATVAELISQEKQLLNTGTFRITDYILALKNLIDAKHSSLNYQIRVQYLINEINLYKNDN